MIAECGLGNADFVTVPYMIRDKEWTVSDAEMADLFDRMYCEKNLETVFYDGTVAGKDDFLAYFKNPDVAAIGAWDARKNPIVWIWLTGIHNGTAFIHFCTFRGPSTRRKVRAACYIVHTLAEYCRCLVGVTPETFSGACHFARALGFETLGTVPQMIYLHYEQKRVGAVISYFVM